MIRDVWKSAVFRVAILVTGTVMAIAYFVPNDTLIEYLRIVQFSTSCAVMVTFAPHAWQALRMGTPDRDRQLALGIFISWSATALLGAWTLAWRLGGYPAWMPNSTVTVLQVVAVTCAAILHLTAPSVIGNRVPFRRNIKVGVAVGVIALTLMSLMTIRPNVEDALEIVRPYLQDRGTPPPRM